MDKMHSKGTGQGFTLIELLITIAMVTILLLIATPSFTAVIESTKQRSARDLLLSAINTAQQQARSQNVSVYLCPTSNGLSCSGAWAGSTGWLVYEDRDRSGSGLNDINEIIVNQIDADVSSIANASALLIFSPTGHVNSSSIFTLCGATHQSGAQITISRMGAIGSVVGGAC